MKGFIIIISCVLFALFLLQKSGVIHIASYTAMEAGTVPVEKTRLGWHPEKLVPYLKELSQKWFRHPLKKGASPTKAARKPLLKPTHRLVLKNGAILDGIIIQKDEKGVLFQVEEGEIFFGQNEIASLEKK